MHSCEMPRGNYWGKVVAMKALDTISSKDYFGVLEYNHLIGVSWAVQLKEAVNKSAIKLAIEKMSNGDMPDFDQTLQMAAAALKERRDAAQRHIIIISDGDASAPNPSVIQGLVDAKITVSTVAIGYGFHAQEATLRSIASQTGGRFYAAKNPKNLPQIFVKESKVVRRPLLVEEPFTPHLSYAMSEVWAGLPLNLAVPQLGGLVMTSPRGGGLIEMPLVRKTADGDDPLLAHWQVGLGKTVAFTSGYWRHWGRNWVDWPNFSKLWAQIVRWTLGQGDQGRFDLGVNVDGTTGRVVVNALDEQGNFINMLNLTAHVSGPAGGGAEGISLQQVGPGRYEGQFEIDATGQYVVGLAQGDQIVGRTGVSVPYSPEYRELKANDALLQEIVDRSRGRIFDLDPAQQADIFRHDLRPTSWRRPVWSWILAWLLLPAFLLDVAVRRLASTVALSVLIEVLFVVVVLFGCQWIYSGGLKGVFVALGVVLLAELLGWLIRWRSIRPAIAYVTSSVTALAGAGQGSARSLEQLKGTRDRVRDERTGAGEAGPALRPIKGPQAAIDADRRQRFDVGEAQAARPAGDLRAELGAAPAAAPAGEAPAGEAEQTEAADTTGRLLQARRRIRHDRDVRPDSGPDEAGKQ
jgi:hypothetical protein